MKSPKTQLSVNTIYPRGILIVGSRSIWSASNPSSLSLVPLVIALVGTYLYRASAPRMQSYGDISSYLIILGEYTSFVIAPSLLLIQSLSEGRITTIVALVFLVAGTYRIAQTLASKQKSGSGIASGIPVSLGAAGAILVSFMIPILGTWIAMGAVLVLSWMLNSPLQLGLGKR